LSAVKLEDVLISVWQQVLVDGRRSVEVDGTAFPVSKTSAKRLRTVNFLYKGERVTGIEQNPRTRSRSAELARQGECVMQFSHKGRYIAVVHSGKLVCYPAWNHLLTRRD
jgi:hypothetical protein